jgi:hypothetical protein
MLSAAAPQFGRLSFELVEHTSGLIGADADALKTLIDGLPIGRYLRAIPTPAGAEPPMR